MCDWIDVSCDMYCFIYRIIYNGYYFSMPDVYYVWRLCVWIIIDECVSVVMISRLVRVSRMCDDMCREWRNVREISGV